MPSISGPSITRHAVDRIRARLFDVGLDELGDAVDERVLEPLLDVPLAPLQRRPFGGCSPVAGVPGGGIEQSFGGIGAAGEHDVLAQLAQLGIDLLVHRELAGVDDAEAHPGLDRAQRNTECIASRTGSLPRNANDRFDTPPETLPYGKFVGDQLRSASMKSSP